MLYLPPGVAHDGVALEPCFTYSIGFRALSVREVGTEFLGFLQDHLDLPGTLYADPDLRPTRAPARLDDALVARYARMIARIRWSRRDAQDFIGRYLSEPKPHVRFAPPQRPLGPAAFARVCARRGIALAPATGLLYRGSRFFVNGEAIDAPAAAHPLLARLADARALPAGTSITPAAAPLLYTWYRAGWAMPAG
jgi:50S ribosomal protein L16 3-hydroxylase